MHSILNNDLNLVKRSARWLPILMLEAQVEERVGTSKGFVELLQEKSNAFLSNIVSMDESAASIHRPETKKQP